MIISYEKFHLKEVINASGKIITLGISKVSEAVLAAQRSDGEHFLGMSEPSVQTEAFLVNLLKVEDAQIVSSASAGIAQSVAALTGKGSLYHAYHPYSEKIEQREIVLSRGHNVDYGTPVGVTVAQGGGQVVEASYVNTCSSEHVEVMISKKTVTILYIKNYHIAQKSMLMVAEAAKAVQRHKVPLIVDVATEEDPFKYTEAGADLMIYSGAKVIEGPSADLVVGKKEYIGWVRLQGKGIDQTMKIGKGNILGSTQAVEEYLAHGSESGSSVQECLKLFVEAINNSLDLTARIVQDGAGRDIYHASVKADSRKTAKEIIQALKTESPAIHMREHQANNGITELDTRSVNQEEMNKIVQRL